MPRIPNNIALCSIFLYPSEADAKMGTNTGGSGFLVHIPSKLNPGKCFVYAITNKHVVSEHEGRCTVIRMNNKHGGVDIMLSEPQNWLYHPGGDDIAALHLFIEPSTTWSSVGTDMFISPEIVDMYQIGYGDEVILVGRLVMHDGRQKNTPIIRFGNISLMADPLEPIKCDGRMQEAFLVDCRSLSGFSGSPAFVTTNQGYRGEQAKKIFERKSPIAEPKPGVAIVRPVVLYGTSGPWLLGIDWGHIPLFSPVLVKRPEGTYDNPGTHSVRQNTGISCVLPAWKILELLNRPEFVAQRDEGDEKLAKLLAMNRTDIN